MDRYSIALGKQPGFKGERDPYLFEVIDEIYVVISRKLTIKRFGRTNLEFLIGGALPSDNPVIKSKRYLLTFNAVLIGDLWHFDEGALEKGFDFKDNFEFIIAVTNCQAGAILKQTRAKAIYFLL